MTRMVHCVKLNKDAEGLDFPPVPGELPTFSVKTPLIRL